MIKLKSGMMVKEKVVNYVRIHTKDGRVHKLPKEKLHISYEGAGLERVAVIEIETEITLEQVMKLSLMNYSGDSVYNYYAGDNYKVY